ncbi:hypothetical protein DLM46_08500 [Paraburkholderia lacunae]|uniref:Uncharacterized protein n=1 Tax=Paraburkholderia lacunae TaxID=2211104 RepID=A0A370NBF0_9BURK|nr:hypothetical protein DLM46_08500 [Paraburkholderia lacunae]
MEVFRVDAQAGNACCTPLVTPSIQARQFDKCLIYILTRVGLFQRSFKLEAVMNRQWTRSCELAAAPESLQTRS